MNSNVLMAKYVTGVIFVLPQRIILKLRECNTNFLPLLAMFNGKLKKFPLQFSVMFNPFLYVKYLYKIHNGVHNQSRTSTSSFFSGLHVDDVLDIKRKLYVK